MDVSHLTRLASQFVILAQGSPEDHIRADKSLASRLNGWSSTNAVKMLDMNIQGKRIKEITFDDKKDPGKEKSFRSSFEADILSKAIGFEGWISLRFPLPTE